MVLNCNNETQIIKLLSDSKYLNFLRGSRVYGTSDSNSDYDFGIIVPDDTEIIDIDGLDCCEKADTRIHNCKKLYIYDELSGKATFADIQVVKSSDFIELINEHSPFALEAILTGKNEMDMYRSKFVLDTWKLRETFSSIANNSWAKAHKKMTVEKDIDMYCGAKSLFHSIRLQYLACQIASGKFVLDLSECDNIWDIIKSDLDSGKDWEYFNEKYKPLYNDAHSEMVKLCPKPEDKYKSETKKKSKRKKKGDNNE